MKNKIIFLSFYLFLCFDSVFAQQTFRTMVENFVNSIKQPIINTMTSAAIAIFAWGVVKYIQDGSISKDNAKSLIVWGIVGITVITAVWAFVDAMRNTLGLL